MRAFGAFSSVSPARGIGTYAGGTVGLAVLRRDAGPSPVQLNASELYSFWVSGNRSGSSGGYIALGDPGFPGAQDF